MKLTKKFVQDAVVDACEDAADLTFEEQDEIANLVTEKLLLEFPELFEDEEEEEEDEDE